MKAKCRGSNVIGRGLEISIRVHDDCILPAHFKNCALDPNLAGCPVGRNFINSQAHFARSFKTAFGVPPHRYLLTRRLERAKALLRDTSLPIIEIAFQTGWNSLGTFGRTFRDITGESPGELRAREQAAARDLAHTPACYLSAAHRPDLRIAVSEKRRQDAGSKTGAEPTEVT